MSTSKPADDHHSEHFRRATLGDIVSGMTVYLSDEPGHVAVACDNGEAFRRFARVAQEGE